MSTKRLFSLLLCLALLLSCAVCSSAADTVDLRPYVSPLVAPNYTVSFTAPFSQYRYSANLVVGAAAPVLQAGSQYTLVVRGTSNRALSSASIVVNGVTRGMAASGGSFSMTYTFTYVAGTPLLGTVTFDFGESSYTTMVATFLELSIAGVAPPVPTFTVTSLADAGGTITPMGAQTVVEGDSITFAIKPDSEHLIDDVIVNGSSVGAVTSYSFTNVRANQTIHAVFTDKEDGVWGIFKPLIKWMDGTFGAWFRNLGEGIMNKLAEVGNFIVDGIKALFLPSEGYFSGLFGRLDSFFEDSFGFLYYPIDHFLELMGRIGVLGDSEPYVVIPEVGWDGHVLIPAGEYRFAEILGNEQFAMIHGYYLMAMDVALIGAFLALLRRKYEEVFKS